MRAQHLREDPANPYRKMMFDLDDLAPENLRNPISSDDVAGVILPAATIARPRERYYTPFSARLQCTLLRLLPPRWLDVVLRRVYKIR